MCAFTSKHTTDPKRKVQLPAAYICSVKITIFKVIYAILYGKMLFYLLKVLIEF